jgi:iron(III) transport system permease protein
LAQAGTSQLEGPLAVEARGWQQPLRQRISPWGIFALCVGLTLCVLTLLPLYHLVMTSLRTQAGLSLANYAQAFSNARFQEAIRNSFILAVACSTSGMLLGPPMAWLVSRTNIPLRGLIRFCAFGSYAVPGFVTGISWVLLAGPNAGYLNRIWMFLLGSERGPFNIYTLPGLVFVSVATVYPLSFLFMYNAFEMMDAESEEAARVLGAGTRRILLTITLPLARPALTAGFILMFMESLILYGVPAVVGVPARVYVVTTQLWALFEYPPRIELATALSLPLLFVTVALLWLQRRMLARRRFATIQGKGGRRFQVDLRRWRWPVFVWACLVILCTLLLPFGVLISASFLDQWYRGFSLDNLSLGNYSFVLFDYYAGALSIRNSLISSGLAATAGVLIATVVAYLVERRLVRFAPVLGFLATMPMVIPGMVVAIGLFATYSGGPVRLFGTLWILALAYLTMFLPLAYMSCSTAISSVHAELESAARVFGASRLRVLREVTIPLMKSALLGGWILIFTPAVKELSASIFLYNSTTTVIGTAIMDAYQLPRWEAVAALSVILLAINAAVMSAGYRFFGANVLGRSG